MRVLIVSYLAPPTGGPRSARVANVGHALLSRGHQVEVLSVDRGESDHHLEAKMSGARFVRVAPGILDRLARRKPSTSTTATRTTISRSLASRLINVLVFPDRQIEWLFPALLKQKKLHRPDLVLSFCPYYSSAIVGHLLAKQWHCPHVVDYGDPWSFRVNNDMPSVRRQIDYYVERAVHQYASGSIVNTQPQAELMKRSFPQSKVVLIPNGFDPNDYLEETELNSDELRHLGALYEIRLSLSPMGEAIQSSKCFNRLVTYGDVFHVDLPPWIERRPSVSFAESIALMQSAKALVVLGNQGALQIPSKLYSYLGARRPILAIVESDADPMFSLGLGPHVVIVKNTAAAIRMGLERVAAFDRQIMRPQEYGWDTLGAKYVQVLAELEQGKPAFLHL